MKNKKKEVEAENENLKAEFVSVWDGYTKITTSCKVNMKTHEIYDIQKSDVEGLNNLDMEYVVIDNQEYEVVHEEDFDKNDKNPSTFWYS